MKKIFIIILFTVPIFSKAQTIESDKIDEFDGTRTIKTTFKKINSEPSLSVMTAGMVIKGKKGADTSITLFFFFETKDVTSRNTDSKVYLKLANNEVMQLPFKGDFKIFSGNEIASMYFDIDDAEMKKILATSVLKMRFQTSREVTDYELTGDASNSINNEIKLINDKLHN